MNASAAALNASSSSSSGAAPPSSYSAGTAALLSCLVAFLIALTLAGNVLVVLAVLTSGGPLRAPQNLFLVSLAGADILVAALVMPFSLANELMGGWAFGRAWCRLYLALDVLFCTSSIVHLCAISLDRYWSVTRALEYNGKRTPGRVKGAILGVWLLSAAISSPPLLSRDWEEARRQEEEGGEQGGEPPVAVAVAVEGPGEPFPGALRCRLNDQTWYILASCVGSFFAPCLVMLLVYLRIYRVAKRRTRRTLSQKRPDGASVLRPQAQEDEVEVEDDDEEEDTIPKPRCGRAVGLQDVELEESSPSEGRRGQARLKSHRHRRCCSSSSSSSSSSGLPRSGSSVRSVEVFSPSSWQRRQRRRRRGPGPGPGPGPGGRPGTAVGSRLCPKALSQAREKRFTLVLAVVMGVFVVCWFPFFFSYSLYGICREACQVPETLFKFFFWIGYCNSSLNPVIYTIFNQDFRRSFKHILFGRTRRKIIDRRLFSLH